MEQPHTERARVDDALRRLDDYVDAAYMAGLPFARIIHGKGTGALRKAVNERVKARLGSA